MRHNKTVLADAWQPPAEGRCAELARQGQLELEDLTELTGLSPDDDGMIEVLEADDSGLRFTLRESFLRGKEAKFQIDARRLIKIGHLRFPCTAARLVEFSAAWGFGLPSGFIAAVDALARDAAEKERALDLPRVLRERGPGRITDTAVRAISRPLTEIRPAEVIGWLLEASDEDRRALGVEIHAGEVRFRNPDGEAQKFTQRMAADRLKYMKRKSKGGS